MSNISELKNIKESNIEKITPKTASTKDNPYTYDNATSLINGFSEGDDEANDFFKKGGVIAQLRVMKVAFEGNEAAQKAILTSPEELLESNGVVSLQAFKQFSSDQSNSASKVFYSLKDRLGRDPSRADFYGALIQEIIDLVEPIADKRDL